MLQLHGVQHIAREQLGGQLSERHIKVEDFDALETPADGVGRTDLAVESWDRIEVAPQIVMAATKHRPHGFGGRLDIHAARFCRNLTPDCTLDLVGVSPRKDRETSSIFRARP